MVRCVKVAGGRVLNVCITNPSLCSSMCLGRGEQNYNLLVVKSIM